MYIVGDQRCQLVVAQPRAVVVALYLREAAGLYDAEVDLIPGLDPPITLWPVWAHRMPPPSGPPPAVDHGTARQEWARWWNRLLGADSGGDISPLHPPAFGDLRPVPQIRQLLLWHYQRAESWTDAVCDDPRTTRALTGPRRSLTALIGELESQPSRIPADFHLRLTVLPVAAKHAWPLGPQHILISQSLMADTENCLDWLVPRIRALAWRDGHISLSG